MEFGDGDYTLSLRELFQGLWRRAWIIILTVAIVVGAAVGLSLLQTPQYESSIRILVGQEQAITETPTEALGLQQVTATIAEAVNSRRVAEAVISDLNLQTDPDTFLQSVSVEQLPETQLVEVTYTNPNPEEARTVANTIGEVFSEQIASESEGANSISASVWDTAQLSEEPSTPNIPRNVILSLVLGLAAGLGLALLLEFIDDRWHSPEEAERVSGVPTLAVIPHFEESAKKSQAKTRKKAKSPPQDTSDRNTTRAISGAKSFEEELPKLLGGAAMSSFGVAFYDGEGRLKHFNDALCGITGYGRDELEGQKLAEFSVHPDDVQGELDLQKELLSGKRDEYRIEKRHTRKDGELIWLRMAVSRMDDASGERGKSDVAMIGTIEDVSERKRVEEEVRLRKESQQVSDARLEAVLEGSPVVIKSYTPDGFALPRDHSTGAGESWKEKLTGGAFAANSNGNGNGSSEEGNHQYNLLSDEYAVSSGLASYVQKSVSEGQPVSTPPLSIETGHNGDREQHWFKAFINPVKDSSGRSLEIVLMLEDITNRKKSENAIEDLITRNRKLEEQVRDSEERFKGFVQQFTGFLSADDTSSRGTGSGK